MYVLRNFEFKLDRKIYSKIKDYVWLIVHYSDNFLNSKLVQILKQIEVCWRDAIGMKEAQVKYNKFVF